MPALRLPQPERKYGANRTHIKGAGGGLQIFFDQNNVFVYIWRAGFPEFNVFYPNQKFQVLFSQSTGTRRNFSNILSVFYLIISILRHFLWIFSHVSALNESWISIKVGDYACHSYSLLMLAHLVAKTCYIWPKIGFWPP